MILMMEAEGGARLHGPTTSTGHSISEGFVSHTKGHLRILNADLEDVFRRKDMPQQHLFVDQEGMGHIFYKALSVRQQGGLQSFP